MTAPPFTITFFYHRSARSKRELQVTLPELRQMIEDQTAERKDLLPFVKFAVFGNLTSEKGSLRYDANVQWVTGCEADYDGEQISVDQAKDIIDKAGIEALIYTSPSHLPDKPRWRIVCPFSERQQPERRALMVARLNGLFHGVLAAESFTLSQSYYYGHVVDADGNPVAHKQNGAGIEIFPTESRVELIEGQPLDLCDELDRGAISKSGRARSDDSGSYTGDYTELEELVRRIISGESLHPSVGSIAGKYAKKRWHIEACIEFVGAAFTMAGQPRYGGRWNECVEYIRWVYDEEARKEPPQQSSLHRVHGEDITIHAIRWLWPNRFASGKLSLIVGLPDEGKGQLLCDAAARCTCGGQWPMNEGTAPLGNVVILTAEDDLGDTVVPRLMSAGADMNRIRFIKMVREGNGERMFSFITDLQLLRQAITEIGDVVLLLIDPLSAYLGVGKIDSFRTVDVRAVLGPLTELAAELRIAIIGVLHFNKKTDVTNALLRISDSLAFAAVARACFGVVDDHDNKRKLLIRAKNNLAPAAFNQTLSYRFGSQMVGKDPDDGSEIWAPHVFWDSTYVDVSAFEAMAAAASTGSPSARNDAKTFLTEQLANGPALMTDIIDAAEAEIIAERTLRRAKRELGVKAKRDGPGGTWRWHPPDAPETRAYYQERD